MFDRCRACHFETRSAAPPGKVRQFKAKLINIGKLRGKNNNLGCFSSMGKEIELKLRMTPQDLRKLKKTERLFPRTSGTSKGTDLLSVYFDTPKYSLNRAGISLRVRHIGRTRVQTIKTKGSGIPFSRGEWEYAIDGDTPNLRIAKDTPLASLLNKKLEQALMPVFTTAVQRIAVPFHENGSLIEIALDDGVVRAGRNTTPIAEVEIELKRGDAADLFNLARKIGKIVPSKLGFKSKSEIGYDMLVSKAPISVRATKIELQRHLTAGEAFQIIGRSGLRHLAANEHAVSMGDSEGVHQMRVGLRRLRAAISVFDSLLTDPQTETVEAELVWMTGELQLVRDLDVYIETDVDPLQNSKKKKRGLLKFVGNLAARRRSADSKLRKSVESPRFRSLILDTLQWLEVGNWLKNSSNSRNLPIWHFASMSLARQTKKILKKQAKLPKLDKRHLHKLRISFKKLRYSCDFFGSLFTGTKIEKRRTRFTEYLKILQDNLGALNDIAVHDKLITSNRLPTSPIYTGLISRREKQRIAPLLKETFKFTRKFSRARPFWT
jgi:inorganic triphosphatase YgiF